MRTVVTGFRVLVKEKAKNGKETEKQYGRVYHAQEAAKSLAEFLQKQGLDARVASVIGLDDVEG